MYDQISDKIGLSLLFFIISNTKWTAMKVINNNRNDEHHQNFLTSQLYNRIYPHIPVFELVNKKRSFSFFLFIVILTLKHVFFGSDPLYNRFACWEFKLKFSNIHGHLFLIISCVIISEVILLPEYNNEFLKRFLNSFSNIQTSSGLNWIVMQHSKHVMDNKQKKILISHWSFTWNQTGQDRAKYRIKYFFRSFVVFTNTIGPYRIDQKMNWIDLNGKRYRTRILFFTLLTHDWHVHFGPYMFGVSHSFSNSFFSWSSTTTLKRCQKERNWAGRC